MFLYSSLNSGLKLIWYGAVMTDMTQFRKFSINAFNEMFTLSTLSKNKVLRQINTVTDTLTDFLKLEAILFSSWKIG